IVTKGSDRIFVTSAAGHLFTLVQTKNDSVPVFDIEWAPSYKVNKGAYFTKKYLDAIALVGRKCAFFINACDYDIEGTVIGTNIIKYVTKGNVNSEVDAHNVKRMRFSTTTNADLIDAYNNLNEFDSTNFDAGEARHRLDWMWGINMSRALMRAISAKGIRKTLSIGRVQGPTLGILAKREIEIKNFVPKPYWKITITVSGVEFNSKDPEIFDKQIADSKYGKAKSSKIMIKSVESREKPLRPFPPFDLTSLQLEASRVFRIDPSRTLAIAQVLYERSYISYPRTSSQKLPTTLNLPRIITGLSKMDEYSEIAHKLIRESRYRPTEGAKEDEAHPAVYPTGEKPATLTEEERQVYDIIARRFLACFADWANLEEKRVTLDVGGEEYFAVGDTIKSAGWLDFYKYYKPKVLELPSFTIGSTVTPDDIDLKSLKTLPPKRFSKASLISLLESKDLGTKATRAEIIDTLFKREYIRGSSIEVTGFGLSVYDALSNYSPNIINEDLTKTLETDMEKIEKGQATKENVIDEGKKIITELVKDFDKNESSIGDALIKGLKESENANILGPCRACKTGSLTLRRSKAGKSFVGCSNWPKCTSTFSVPQYAKIVPTGKTCELCKTPIIKVFRKAKRPFEMDLDPACETKKDWGKPKDKAAKAPEEAATVKSEKAPKPVKEALAAAPAQEKPKKLAKKKAAKPKTKKAKPKKVATEQVEGS
ncbi:MAG: DNA topoisomerase I, partial [Candidatus Micrarchaeota archaeon]|nr:DNA topoisomerase I [Candidatus Micrarchaeota archaeon]